MKVVFKHTQTRHLDLSYMAYKLLNNYKLLKNNCTAHTFEYFLYDYLECEEKLFNSPNNYDNWYEIRTSVYNNLFVYCAENNLEEELEILKRLKDF